MTTHSSEARLRGLIDEVNEAGNAAELLQMTKAIFAGFPQPPKADWPSDIIAAKTLLTISLAGGPQLVNEIRREAKEMGVSRAALSVARSELRIEPCQPARPGPMYWRFKPPVGSWAKKLLTGDRQ